jgi:hypothetical protein
MTKQLDASWAVGTDAGGLDTGAVAATTWYYVYIIRKDSDGSIDALFSLSDTEPTMPAGYTYKRRIGEIYTLVTTHYISPFFQVGNRFFLKTRVLSVNTTNPGASAVLSTMICPPSQLAVIESWIYNTDGTGGYYLFTSPSEVDSTPSGALCDGWSDSTDRSQHIDKTLFTDSSSRIRYRFSATTTNTTISIFSLGWIDTGI